MQAPHDGAVVLERWHQPEKSHLEGMERRAGLLTGMHGSRESVTVMAPTRAHMSQASSSRSSHSQDGTRDSTESRKSETRQPTYHKTLHSVC